VTRRVIGILLLLIAAQAAYADVLRGRVVRIADGDTLTLLDATKQQHRVRMTGIDAPENGQAFGARSKTSLSALVFDKEVQAECVKRDQYGRELCKILVGGTDVNLEQIRTGMAWWYKHYAREQSREDRASYENAELQAKIRRLGLWADKNPVPPWDWRRK